MKQCIICHLRIDPGQRYFRIESGELTLGSKSGRPMLTAFTEDLIHYECMPDYMAASSGEVYDSIYDRVLDEVRREQREEKIEELRAEVYDMVVDEMGRTCVVCAEEIDDIRDRANEDDHQDDFVPLPSPSQLPFNR